MPTANQAELEAGRQAEPPYEEGTVLAFKAVDPPEHCVSDRRSIVVVPRVELNSRIKNTIRADEGLSLRLAMLFEEHENRYPVRVEHIHGYESLGCDVVSFFDQGEAQRFEQTRQLEPASVARFIEVKGRSDRGGNVELTQNERAAAERRGSRYYVYLVVQDRDSPEPEELAILCDPVNGGAEIISHRFTYGFHQGSGAKWFELSRLPNKASKVETFFEIPAEPVDS